MQMPKVMALTLRFEFESGGEPDESSGLACWLASCGLQILSLYQERESLPLAIIWRKSGFQELICTRLAKESREMTNTFGIISYRGASPQV
jgi:hypothetical protein